MNIAIIGRRGSGKTTISNYLVEEAGYTRHSWAAPVKQIASWAYGEIDKAGRYGIVTADGPKEVTGRWILQHIGTDALRDQVDQAFWIKVGLRKIDDAFAATDRGAHRFATRIWVNDDTRFPNEVEALRSRGFRLFKLEVPTEVRAARLGADYSPEGDLHPSETEIEKIEPDYRIDGTLPVEQIADYILARQ